MYKGKHEREIKSLLSLLERYEGKRVDKFDNSKNYLIFVKNSICLTILLCMVLGINGRQNLRSSFSNSDKSSVSIDLSDFQDSELDHIRSISKNNIDDLINSSQYLRETIFIGDSRTQGILSTNVTSEEQTIYGVGYGYNWLVGNGSFSSSNTNAVNGAINELFNRLEDSKLYNIVIWLGVNDCTFVKPDKYFEEYVNLANQMSDQNIYIVSVGPVYENGNCPRTNKQINDFNDRLRSLVEEAGIENLKFIDLDIDYSFISKYDGAGIHYGSNDYVNIYNIISESIDLDMSLSLKK